MAYTGRHPSVTDAWALGYTTGVREDCSFQIDSYPNVSLPVLFLDNNFHDPDLDRFLDQVGRYDPEIAVIGDAYSAAEADHEQLFPAVVDISVGGTDPRFADSDIRARVRLQYRFKDEPQRLQNVEIEHRNPEADQLNPAITAFVVRHLRSIGFGGELPEIDWEAEYETYAEEKRPDLEYSQHP